MMTNMFTNRLSPSASDKTRQTPFGFGSTLNFLARRPAASKRNEDESEAETAQHSAYHCELARIPKKWWQPAVMANSKKLSRADVHKQIDAFRGIFKRNPDGKLSAEQWVETKRAENGNRWAMKPKPVA
jgi:hypothetical protein